jgi:hypothetical protein
MKGLTKPMLTQLAAWLSGCVRTNIDLHYHCGRTGPRRAYVVVHAQLFVSFQNFNTSFRMPSSWREHDWIVTIHMLCSWDEEGEFYLLEDHISRSFFSTFRYVKYSVHKSTCRRVRCIYKEDITWNGHDVIYIEFNIIIARVVYCDMMTETSSADR